MTLEILTPEKSVYKGEASLVQLPGVDGLFEILDGHAPLIAALSKGTIKYKTASETFTLNISGGFAECRDNTVSVLAEALL
ncbi:MAG: ATP synthase F1 subunit epsilon [Chitinophagales bacterium]|nr:ATP synthase F1 subunit epsilon [Chitinophagales bacterium]MDW8274239.1 ATP synthase F1 subunit epsilon [Chitinophagales bacterium]